MCRKSEKEEREKEERMKDSEMLKVSLFKSPRPIELEHQDHLIVGSS